MPSYPDEPTLSPKFLSIWDAFTAQKLKNKRTSYEYMLMINSICSYLSCDFLEITIEGAKYFFLNMVNKSNQSEKKLSVKTLNGRYSCLRSIGNFIAEHRDIFELPDYINVFLYVDIAHYSEMLNPSSVPSLEELDRLLTSVKGDDMLYLIFCLVIRCGFSAGEICSLAAEHIQIDGADRAFVLITHGKVTRQVKIPPDVFPVLSSYANERGIVSGPLFHNLKGGPLTYKTLNSYVKSAVKAAGLSFTLQDMRNASIAHMLVGGASFQDTASYVGISERWMYRYKDVLESLDTAPCDYQNFRIK